MRAVVEYSLDRAVAVSDDVDIAAMTDGDHGLWAGCVRPLPTLSDSATGYVHPPRSLEYLSRISDLDSPPK